MANRDYRDIIGGVLMILLGLFAALYATEHYRLGTTSRMGPGMFPAALGWILMGLGVLVIIPALFRQAPISTPRYRSFFACLAAVGLFGFLADHVGVIPSLFAMVGVSAVADNKLGAVGAMVLAIAVSLVAWLIFFVGLEMTVPLFKWDWRV